MKRNDLAAVSILACGSVFLGLCVHADASAPILRFEDKVTHSDVIVAGDVVGKTSYWNEEHTSILTDVTMTVSEIMKGDGVGRTFTFTIPGGEADGWRQSVIPGVEFEVGENVAVFAKRFAAGFVVESYQWGSSEESVGERAGFLGRILGRLKIA